jgi:hypothetical protein
MSAETHVAELIGKSGKIAHVRVRIVHGDERMICTSKSCALQLLWDAAHPSLAPACPLNQAISVENRLDFNWLVANEDRFIDQVRMFDAQNYPVPEDMDIGTLRGTDPDALPQATLEITVTDERWLDHLRKDAPWDTVLVDVSYYV